MAKTSLLFIALSTLLIAGCSTPPPPPPPAPEGPPTLLMEFQIQASDRIDAGGIAAVGIGESKALNIALNRAKAHGRRELARALQMRIETLQTELAIETGRKDTAFAEAAEAIIETRIQRCTATDLRYETVDRIVLAYTLMELSPKVILDEIAKKDAASKSFNQTATCEQLERAIQTYETFKTPPPTQE